jgi:putative oxidoreductase
LAPRAALGATMLYHGIGKLRDPASTRAAFGSLGIRPAGFWARATGIAEASAGALALAGALVRPAAIAVLVTQAMAIAKVHARKGFAIEKGGFEFNLALMAIATALLVGGAGRYSGSRLVDRAIQGPRPPRRWWRRRRRLGLLALLVHALG